MDQDYITDKNIEQGGGSVDKRKILILTALGICFALAFVWFLATLPPIVDTTALEDKQESEYTMAEGEALLFQYLYQNGQYYRVGTRAFYDYALNQAIYGTDACLASHAHYRLIHTYLTAYISAHDNWPIAPPLFWVFLRGKTVGELSAEHTS